MRASDFITGVAILFALAGCEAANSGDVPGSGGTTSSGGAGSSKGGSGGASSSSSGGASSGGSTMSSAGTLSAGGSTSAGGTGQSGGSESTGSTTSRGGAGGTLSSSGGGGTAGTQTTTSAGGQTGTGGASARGGATASGGTSSSGGNTSSGGQTGTGGATASGGSQARDAGADARAVSPDAALCTPGGTCTEPNQSVTSGTGTHCCYTYENWVNTGSATLTLKPDGFSVNWTGSTQFVGRKGIRPGTGKIVTEYSATFSPNGNSYLCLYGWTTEPLAEYYVVDGWGSWRPPGGTALGTVSSDGGTYDIYKMTRTNEPSIIGTATFPQYWSVRQQKKTSGTITLANHITAWASKGMPMGAFYEVSMTVEGYQSSGTADVKFSMK